MGWDKRKLARIMSERAKGQSIASSRSHILVSTLDSNSSHPPRL